MTVPSAIAIWMWLAAWDECRSSALSIASRIASGATFDGARLDRDAVPDLTHAGQVADGSCGVVVLAPVVDVTFERDDAVGDGRHDALVRYLEIPLEGGAHGAGDVRVGALR